MRQAVMTSPGVIEFRDAQAPTPGPGQVLLRIHRIGVCGSDMHVYHGNHPLTPYPVVQGHEYSATVEALGPGVDGVRVGAKVTATPQEVCGKCRPCLRGQYNICEKLKVRGFQAPGVAQDLFVTEVDKLVPLPDNFTPEQGAFVEPVAVAAHATGRAGDLSGRNVVVMGAGPIGNLVAQGAKARGAGKVLIVDPSDNRLAIAGQVAIDATTNPATESLADASRRVFGEDGFDIVFECSGSQPALTAAVAAIGKGGTIVSVGVFGKKPEIDMMSVCEHELSVIGSMMYRHEDYEQAVRWIADGAIRLGPLESKHFAFSEYLAAYRYVDEQGDKCVKVFVDL